MKKIVLSILFLILPLHLHAQEYTILAPKSSAVWVGYGELGGFSQEGSIDLKTGTIILEDGKPVSGIIIFDASSIDHDDKQLKKHLKAKDFFHVAKYPEISFEITKSEGNKVLGKLTVRGITLVETFTFSSTEKDGFMIFSGESKIDRTKYGIKYNSTSYFQDLGNYAIKNEFDLNFRLVFRPQ